MRLAELKTLDQAKHTPQTQISGPESVNRDSITAYLKKLKTIRKKLDSLNTIHQDVSTQLNDLKDHSARLRKEQRQNDLINGTLLLLVAIVLIKVIHGRLKRGSQKRG